MLQALQNASNVMDEDRWCQRTSKARFFCLLPTFLALIFLTYVPLLNGSKLVPTYAGPYTGYNTKWYKCAENESDGTGIMSFRTSYYRPHFRTPQTITGNMTWKAEFNDTYWLKVKFDVWSNNQWKDNAILLRTPSAACTHMRNIAPGLFGVVFHISKHPAPCVLPPGVYTVENAPIDWTSPVMPVLPYGVYRLQVWWGIGKTKKMCTTAECVITPRVS